MSVGQPTIADLWEGKAEFALSDEHIGAAFNMYFPSIIWVGQELYAYFIAADSAGGEPGGIGIARSKNGIDWFPEHELALHGGGVYQWVYYAADLGHQTGAADGRTWFAASNIHDPGYMCYGPYTNSIPGGRNDASFRMMIDNVDADNLTVATIDVNDASTQTVLATVDINRHDFEKPNEFRIFHLNFEVVQGHSLEFRTRWYKKALIRQEFVGIAQGWWPFFDESFAEFPGVWRDGDTFYLVYEGSPSGDIGLAVSNDGLRFLKEGHNPILIHSPNGWEQANIGTPSLFRKDDTWYLYYHGYDGRCQIGVATGSDLHNLQKHGDPVIKAGSSDQWDCGTTGRRSQIQFDKGYYYMAFEGSTYACGNPTSYQNADWSSGVARSINLIDWEKFPGNPVIPVHHGMGNDGPELVTIDGVLYLYVRASITSRYKLQWKIRPIPPEYQQFDPMQGRYYIRNKMTGEYLSQQLNILSPKGPGEIWDLLGLGDGSYRIRNVLKNLACIGQDAAQLVDPPGPGEIWTFHAQKADPEIVVLRCEYNMKFLSQDRHIHLNDSVGPGEQWNLEMKA